MSILFVMIPLALALLAAAIGVFFWAVGSGQFDDLEAQGALVLFDRPLPRGTADRTNARNAADAASPARAAHGGSDPAPNAAEIAA